MLETADLLRREVRARVFFAAHAQSSLGTGVGYVALLLVAYERFASPWAVALVLIAELVPAMLLGTLFGALADRWSRKWCTVVADGVRAAAFVGVILVDSFVATIGFALLAGVGTALFTPAALAALPSLVDDRLRVPASTSLYGAITESGFTGGLALSGVLLAITDLDTVLAVNAATFAVSAAVLGLLRFGDAPGRAEARQVSLRQNVGEGIAIAVRLRGIRVVLLASAAALLCAGMFNVAELFYATEDVGTTQTGFSALVACFGAGVIVGSLAGSKGGEAAKLKRRYLAGLLILGLGVTVTAFVETFAIAAILFVLVGFGNGLNLVYERLLIQAAVDQRFVGRVFGLRDSLTAWAFAFGLAAGGALLAGALSTGELLVAAGGVALLVWAASALALRREWPAGAPERPETPAEAVTLGGDAHAAGLDSRRVGEDGTDLIGRADDLGLEALDHSE